MVGHVEALLQGMSPGESADSRAERVRRLAANIYNEWSGGQDTINEADHWARHYRTNTSVMIKEGEEFKRGAVAAYRKAVLAGLSPSVLDKAILEYGEMPPALFSEFKGALSDLTSGKYPQSDLVDVAPMTRKPLEVGKPGMIAGGSEQAILKAEVKAIQAAGIGASEAEAAFSVRSLLSVIKNAKALAIGGVQATIADFIVKNAVGALHQLIVKDPSHAESLARLIEENKQSGKNRDLNNIVEY